MKRPSFLASGFYDVPDWYTYEEVLNVYPRYAKKLGEHWESQGYEIVKMFLPVKSSNTVHQIFCQPDQVRYSIRALITRKPEEIHLDIPDEAVPEMQKIGLTLTE